MLCWSLSSFNCWKSCAREEEVLASNAEPKRNRSCTKRRRRCSLASSRTKAAAKTTAATDDWKTTWQRSWGFGEERSEAMGRTPQNMRRASLSSPSCSTGGAAASTYTQKDLVETLLQTVSRDSRFLSQRERKEIAVSAATWRVWEIVIKSPGTTSQSSPFHDIFPDSSRW